MLKIVNHVVAVNNYSDGKSDSLLISNSTSTSSTYDDPFGGTYVDLSPVFALDFLTNGLKSSTSS